MRVGPSPALARSLAALQPLTRVLVCPSPSTGDLDCDSHRRHSHRRTDSNGGKKVLVHVCYITSRRIHGLEMENEKMGALDW